MTKDSAKKLEKVTKSSNSPDDKKQHTPPKTLTAAQAMARWEEVIYMQGEAKDDKAKAPFYRMKLAYSGRHGDAFVVSNWGKVGTEKELESVKEFDTDEKAVAWFEKTKKAKLACKGWGESYE